MQLSLKTFFHTPTNTLSYIVFDPHTKDAVLIDPVMDYTPETQETYLEAVHEAHEFIRSAKIQLHWILDTHVHADHLSGSRALQRLYPQATIGMNNHITKVQSTFAPILHMSGDFATDGSQFQRLLHDGEVLHANSFSIRVLYTPGHTPACTSFVIEDMVFTGDALFMPDSGTGRCDFPGGDAQSLYSSIMHKIYTLPDHFRVCTGHDYQPNGRPLQYAATIADQKQHNIHLHAETKEADFIKFRTERDLTLKPPRLLEPSLRANLIGGY